MGYLATALKLMRESSAMDARRQGKSLLQTPQAELTSPLLIESAYLGECLHLVANEAQAQEIEQAGGDCYLPSEIRALLNKSAGMDEEALRNYLGKVHMVKRVFPGSRIKQE